MIDLSNLTSVFNEEISNILVKGNLPMIMRIKMRLVMMKRNLTSQIFNRMMNYLIHSGNYSILFIKFILFIFNFVIFLLLGLSSFFNDKCPQSCRRAKRWDDLIKEKRRRTKILFFYFILSFYFLLLFYLVFFIVFLLFY